MIISVAGQRCRWVLLIEQNAMMALSVSDYGYILSHGRVTKEGPARDPPGRPRGPDLLPRPGPGRQPVDPSRVVEEVAGT